MSQPPAHPTEVGFQPFAIEWALVAAAVSATASVFNAIDEAIANRSIQDNLHQIKKYLIDLRQQLDRVEAQNAQILSRLDRLPQQIRRITEEVVEVALLNERYATLRDIELNIFELGEHRRYRIREQGWRELSGAITYIEAYENRLSQMFRLIQACELALAATRGRASPIVKRWVSDKVNRIAPLVDDVAARIDEDLAALARMLNNRTYIAEHNLSPDLTDLDQLTWQGQPNRTRTEHYQEEECVIQHEPCRGPVSVCRTVNQTRQVPDSAFHSARDAYLNRVGQSVDRLKSLLEEYSHMVHVRDRLLNYLKSINTSAAAEMTLFYEMASLEAAGLSEDSPMTEADYADMLDYFEEERVDPESTQAVAVNRTDMSDEGEIVGRFKALTSPCY